MTSTSNSQSNEPEFIIIDDPAPMVRRITLNRPEKRNAMNNELRTEVFRALEEADVDDSVRVTILRGAGKAFCSGYDLTADNSQAQPYFSSGGAGSWPRHVSQGWFNIWDLQKPVIAQVHGYCLAGGTELATSCDLVYVAEDAQIGYPVTRSISPPDFQWHPWLLGMRAAMELMLTGDSFSGLEAVRLGFANRAFPIEELDQGVLNMAERVAITPTDLQQINKRTVHRAMETMGMRTAIRAGSELMYMATQTETTKAWTASIREKGLTSALDDRDTKFGDYRTKDTKA